MRERVKTDRSRHETILQQRKGIRLADPTNESTRQSDADATTLNLVQFDDS